MKTSVQFYLNESVVDVASLSSWLAFCWQDEMYPLAKTFEKSESEYAVELSDDNPVWLRLRRLEKGLVEIACILDPHSFEQLQPNESKVTLLARVVDELSVALSTRSDVQELRWVPYSA